jgi:hypothetical protein
MHALIDGQLIRDEDQSIEYIKGISYLFITTIEQTIQEVPNYRLTLCWIYKLEQLWFKLLNLRNSLSHGKISTQLFNIYFGTKC